MSKHIQPTISMFDGAILRQAVLDALRKLNPGDLVRNPVIFVTEVVALLVTVLFVRDLATGAIRLLHGTDRGLALVHGDLRQLRRGRGRRAGPGAGRHPAPGAHPDRRQAAVRSGAQGTPRERVGARSRHRRPRAGRGRRPDPGRRRGGGGHRLGQRGGDHGRVRSRHPRVRRRPLRRHGRHHGDLRLARGADHRSFRLLVPRPDDRARGRSRAAEDAERDRPQRPAGRHDHRLPDRRRHAGGLRPLFRSRRPGAGAGGAARHADPDDHRRPAFGHRHRRHGPPHPLQRARHVGPGGGGRGRRRHAAPRQDGHHHLRQPHGLRDHPGFRRHGARGGAGSPAGEPCRRDRRGTLDRGARRRRSTGSSLRTGAGGCPLHRILGDHAALRRRYRRRRLRKGAVDAVLRFVRDASGRAVPDPGFAAAVDRIARSGGTPLGLADGRPRSSASFTSRTSSSPTSRSASPNCAAWASAPSW